MIIKSGTVFWITGLAGAGKSTFGRLLRDEILANTGKKSILIDGDEIRSAFKDAFGYTRDERLELSFSYSRLCLLFSQQGFDVICCTVSMFHGVREWNRAHIVNYKEVYLKVDETVLHDRNQKNLYKANDFSSQHFVVGKDSSFEEPKNSDVIIENDGSKTLSKLLAEHKKTIMNW